MGLHSLINVALLPMEEIKSGVKSIGGISSRVVPLNTYEIVDLVL